MRFLLLFLACILPACGGPQAPAATPVQTPRPPIGKPNVGVAIELLSPIDSRRTGHSPTPIGVPAGQLELAWTPVERAHGYIVAVGDATAAGETGRIETEVLEWTTEPRMTIEAGEPGRVLILQVFAYRTVDVVGQSQMWMFAAE